MILVPEVGDVVRFKNVCWINSVGETSHDWRGVLSFRARVTKAWEDEETGWRFWAALDEDVKAVDEFSGKSLLLKGMTVFVGQFDVVKEGQ